MSEEEIKNVLDNLIFDEYEWLLNYLEQDREQDLEMVENAIQGLLDLYNKEKEKNKELEKYDYRKIKIEEKNKISSIHFTKEQLDLMNLGIALYVGIPKILADTEDEETYI